MLYDDYTLSVYKENVDKTKIQNNVVVLKYDICLEKGEEKIYPNSTFTIKINLPKNVYKVNNVYVYQKMTDGTIKLVQSNKTADGNLVITSSTLGEFYITTEDERWINYADIASIIVLSSLCVIFTLVTIKKSKKNKK